MTRIVTLSEIRRAMDSVDMIAAMETAFSKYSNGEVVVPPVAEMLFSDPPGEVHIKYGFIVDDDIFVIKVATGFPHNWRLGVPSFNGLLLVFAKRTGHPLSVLLDGGELTNIRTAAAGAVAAKYLAPPRVAQIAILGAGTQARLQVEYLAKVTTCRTVSLWARRTDAAKACAADLNGMGFEVELAPSVSRATHNADLIVSTTSSEAPLLELADVKQGAHINAIGSDTPFKQELSTDLCASADLVVTDSLSQCVARGEIHHAIKAGKLDIASVVELGAIIQGTHPGRKSADQTTIADLTGVAVQDIAAAKGILEAAVRDA